MARKSTKRTRAVLVRAAESFGDETSSDPEQLEAPADDSFMASARTAHNKTRLVPVVALGASAGGLEPLEQFFDASGSNTGIAFVVIQHLSPDFESMMGELLARLTKMTVCEATDGLEIQPNTIYLNPPRTEMRVKEGCFRLGEAPARWQLHLPINTFLLSIAQEYKSRALGIVLSGTGSDGTIGARAIKEAGGRVLVQTPDSAQFPAMPESVIKSGLADTSANPNELFELVRQFHRAPVPARSNDNNNSIHAIFAILRERFGTEFGFYKDATIIRRLNQRIQAQRLSFDNYLALLQTDKEEVETLYAALLVEVTTFFRDREAFDVLKTDVVPALVDKMSETEPIRVWVPGCASGEEAYSLAILFADCAAEQGKPLNLKIFATDIHSRSLNAASNGLYDIKDLTGLTDAQRENYFEPNGTKYQVKRSLRSHIGFSEHNVLKDAPFTRMHLVSCRNVLIYFNGVAQRQTLVLFHSALPKDGFLFLGPSEGLSKLDHEFSTIDQKWRVFKKNNDSRLLEANTLLRRNFSVDGILSVDAKLASQSPQSAPTDETSSMYESALQEIGREYGPPGFLLNAKGDILHVFGDAVASLNLTSGEFSSNILALIDERLQSAVTTGLGRLKASNKARFQRRVLLGDGEIMLVSLRALATKSSTRDAQSGDDLTLFLTFESLQEVAPAAEPSQLIGSAASDQKLTDLINQIHHLEADLASTERSLQATVESFETSNEELQASNEELMASNEELQSTNEELHSVNEELFTVSAEHQRKIKELSELTDDMNLLFDATDIGVIFLDQELCVRRFTPSAQLTFNLLQQDLGRPISHITHKFTELDLMAMLHAVRGDGKQRHQEIDVDGDGFVLRVLPYVGSGENSIGEVITTVDISEVKQEQAARIQDARQYEWIVSDFEAGIARWRANDNIVVYCNETFSARHGGSVKEILGQDIFDVSNFKDALHQKVRSLQVGESLSQVSTLTVKNGRDKFISTQIRAIGDADGELIAYQGVGRDVTDEQRYLKALEALAEVDQSAGEDATVMLDSLLSVGSDYFDMPTGSIGLVVGDELHLSHSRNWASTTLKPGHVLQLKGTIAHLLPPGDAPLAIPNIAASQHANTAIFKERGYRSFLGANAISVGVHGTVGFASSVARDDEVFGARTGIPTVTGPKRGYVVGSD